MPSRKWGSLGNGMASPFASSMWSVRVTLRGENIMSYRWITWQQNAKWTKQVDQTITYESRAETHERFYIIEVHRHRFEMSARKVPLEKCTRWRKVCGRSAKDQIGDSIYLEGAFLNKTPTKQPFPKENPGGGIFLKSVNWRWKWSTQ